MAVRNAGGMARSSLLITAGVARGDLGHAVREGRLLRPRNGVYVVPETSAAIVEAISHRGAAACVTAAREHGLWTLASVDDARRHTWVEPQYEMTRLMLQPHPSNATCCVFHRDHRIDKPTLGCVGILHCLVQLLRCRGDESFFAALESALALKRIDEEGRERLRRVIPERSRWLVDFARGDAGSGLESLVRLRLHRHGISPACQVSIPGVGVVDFVIGDCLILEADGGTHDGPARHTDRMRDAVAMTLGFVTLRFDYAMIVHDWPIVEDTVLAAVRHGLHRSTSGAR